MSLLVLIGGIIVVRLCVKFMEELDSKLRAFISTVIACLIGIWALSVDINEFEDPFDAILFVPSLLAVGTSFMAVTLCWETDNGVWSESFRVGNTSFGHKTGTLSVLGMIFLVLVFSGLAHLFIFAFMGTTCFVVYYIFHTIILLKALFKKD